MHRLMVESEIGRYLYKGEVVHHKNGNKTDNRFENLQIMTVSEHRKLHMVRPQNLGAKKHIGRINEMIELRKKGLFAYQIADTLNIPRRTVQRYCLQFGLGRHIRMRFAKRDKLGKFITNS